MINYFEERDFFIKFSENIIIIRNTYEKIEQSSRLLMKQRYWNVFLMYLWEDLLLWKKWFTAHILFHILNIGKSLECIKVFKI